jgi:hypothetical protein
MEASHPRDLDLQSVDVCASACGYGLAILRCLVESSRQMRGEERRGEENSHHHAAAQLCIAHLNEQS